MVDGIKKRFSNQNLEKVIVLLFLEQLLVMLVGLVETFMFCGRYGGFRRSPRKIDFAGAGKAPAMV